MIGFSIEGYINMGTEFSWNWPINKMFLFNYLKRIGYTRYALT